jgi:hypothetical protein
MWETDSLWLEVAIVSIIFLFGHIILGHFEEKTPKWRKVLKFFGALGLVLYLSIALGRMYAFAFLGFMFFPVLYIHTIWLPKKGINGWTGEPKAQYYALRGWKMEASESNPYKAGNDTI